MRHLSTPYLRSTSPSTNYTTPCLLDYGACWTALQLLLSAPSLLKLLRPPTFHPKP